MILITCFRMKIAKHPLNERDKSKLLIYNKESIKEDIFLNITLITYLKIQLFLMIPKLLKQDCYLKNRQEQLSKFFALNLQTCMQI